MCEIVAVVPKIDPPVNDRQLRWPTRWPAKGYGRFIGALMARPFKRLWKDVVPVSAKTVACKLFWRLRSISKSSIYCCCKMSQKNVRRIIPLSWFWCTPWFHREDFRWTVGITDYVSPFYTARSSRLALSYPPQYIISKR
jgi:hypothetical protein